MTSPSEANDELSQLRALVTTLQQENALLRQKIDALARRIFGSSSEKVSPAQLELLLQLPQETSSEPVPPPLAQEKAATPKTHPQKQRAPRLPDHLPVIEEVIEPQEVLAAPQDWRQIGEEVSEQLDYEPARFLRRRTVRRKYVRRGEVDLPPIIAPLPEKLLERGIAGAGLLAHILVSKYCDHLPLYRQEQIYAQRHNVNLPRQTLARWVELAADWLLPIYEQIRTGVLGDGYVQVDETPVAYLAPGHGQTKQGYLWTCLRPGGDVFYRWEVSRAAECLDRVVGSSFKGVVQCDGYSAYRAYASGHTSIKLAGCWAHARRNFHEALDQSRQRASWILRQVQHLYRIESMLREQNAGPALRQAVRSHQSRPIVDRVKQALLVFKASRQHLPKSLLGEALDYALGQWTHLEQFLTDGRIELDNNLVENAIRPTAVGKKNWLFMGEAGAGQRGAIIYTIVECCRRRKIDPYTYLRDVLSRLPSFTNHQLPSITPAAWAKTASKPQS